MGRWQPEARARLEQAALELFEEKGFEETTVAEIAERAGLTKRTFFRYFTDKREVLFGGSALLQESFEESVRDAPADAAALAAVEAALFAVAGIFEERRDFAARRQRIISASPELRERELIKLAALGAAVDAALRARGVDARAATLTAEAGMAVFRVSFERWVSEPGGDLAAVLRDSLAELRAVAA
ncbi:MAG TPA: TetR family transcriptional regulator [Solirubrobacteraceae bacterium]|nr:TetR family transcriptional regulator [Solirubrobacteraceae bacterium]